MRVQFEYTLDDVVDVQLRALKRSAVARAWRWRDLAFTSLLSGVLLFAITGRLIVGVVGLILGALLYPPVTKSTVKRRLKKFFQENAGPGDIFICEVELSEAGVHTRQNGMEIICRWENVREIQETRESVDISAEKGGLVVVRKRAFNGLAEQKDFIELANQYLKAAHL